MSLVSSKLARALFDNMSSCLAIFHLILLLGSTVVIKEVEAQRPFQLFINRIQDLFANLRPLGNQPSITQKPWPIQEPEDLNSVEAVESGDPVTELTSDASSTVVIDPITVTVTEWSTLDQPATTVPIISFLFKTVVPIN